MKIKRFVSLFLAAMMALSCAVFVSAAPVAAGTTGTITVNAKETGRTYVAYEVLQETATGTGGNSYTVAPGMQTFLQDYVKTAQSSTSTPTDAQIVDYIAGLSASADRLSFSNALTTYIAAHPTAGFTSYTLAASAADSTSYSKDVVLGYYVVEDETSGTTDGYAPSLVMLSTVDKAVTITAKDATITNDKKVGDKGSTTSYTNASDYSIGQTVPYEITATVPADTDSTAGLSSYTLNMKDSLPTGMKYLHIDSITINGTALSDTTLSDILSHATITVGSGSSEAPYASGAYASIANATSFTLNFKLFDSAAGLNLIKGTKLDIVVKYSAVITKDAAVYSDLTNTYTLTVGRNGQSVPVIKTAKVDTYGLTIDKTDMDGAPLSGAVFVLEDSNGNYISCDQKDSTKTNGEYVVNGTTTKNAPTATSYTGYGLTTTDSDGQITISGLAAGQYTITELVAPSGYNILAKPQNVTVYDTQSKNTVTVQDSKAVVLPSTGGIGTWVFFAGGCVILLGAAAVLVLNRKKIFSK